jgi:hypothetical protein
MPSDVEGSCQRIGQPIEDEDRKPLFSPSRISAPEFRTSVSQVYICGWILQSPLSIHSTFHGFEGASLVPAFMLSLEQPLAILGRCLTMVIFSNGLERPASSNALAIRKYSLGLVSRFVAGAFLDDIFLYHIFYRTPVNFQMQ